MCMCVSHYTHTHTYVWTIRHVFFIPKCFSIHYLQIRTLSCLITVLIIKIENYTGNTFFLIYRTYSVFSSYPDDVLIRSRTSFSCHVCLNSLCIATWNYLCLFFLDGIIFSLYWRLVDFVQSSCLITVKIRVRCKTQSYKYFKQVLLFSSQIPIVRQLD